MKRIVKWKSPTKEVLYTGIVYYLNRASGNDSSNGLSTTNAWKTESHAIEVMVDGDVLLEEDEGGTYAGIPSAGRSDFAVFKLNNITYNNITQIIADHTIVDDYALIPQSCINTIKTWLVNIMGESHGTGYHYGLQGVEALDAKFAHEVDWYSTPPAVTSDYLRSYYSFWTGSGYNPGAGEQNWYTSAAAIQTMKNHMDYFRNTLNNPIAVMMFAWCWDMVWVNSPTAEKDPVYGCGWAGTSEGGPEGSLAWGLDAADEAITGNSVCMDTYLEATQAYIDHDALTKVVFTTGPVDSYNGEAGYQRSLKDQHIRDYVALDTSRILFDYADILCYNNSDELNTQSWNGHTYPYIHSDNLTPEYTGAEGTCHISEAGCLRLGKALWWMLARIAGWDGNAE